MAVAADYAGWVRELDNYEASMDNGGDDDPRIEDGSGVPSRRLHSRGGSAATSRKGKPGGASSRAPSVADELQQEMKLLNWHKLANEAALKAAIIKTNKIKGEDSRFATSLAHEDGEEKRQRIQQIIEEEQLKPLQVNTEFFRAFEAREQKDENKIDNDVQRHIQHLKRLKETMAQREDMHRRRQLYKTGMQELGGGPRSHSVPKGHKSNQDDELSSHAKRHHRSSSTAHKAEGSGTADVICSLDKLMELEKRIRHLEDAGLGVDGLDDDADADNMLLDDIDDNNLTSTKNIRFSKRKSSGAPNEPSKTVYAVKTVTKAKAKDKPRASLSKPTAASAARKRSLHPHQHARQETFMTSLPENKQRQLRRMTERERRNFLKKEKAAEVKEQAQKQDVVIQDWMQKKKHAAQQRKTTSHQASATTSGDASGGAARRGAGKHLPPSPKVKAPLRGAAAGKHIANPHLQKFDDIRKGLERRKESMGKAPTNVSSSNKVLDLRTSVNDKRHKRPAGAASGHASTTTKHPGGTIAVGSRTVTSSATANHHAPAAPLPRRQPSDAAPSSKLPAISRMPPSKPAASHSSGLGTNNHRPGAMTGLGLSATASSSGAKASSLGGVTLPRLNASQRVGMGVPMPSPPPASAKNPSMPQFSRLHKR